MFSHWWKRKGQKRRCCSGFCHPELFLKVWLDLNEWVAAHLYNIVVPCSMPSLAQRLLGLLQVRGGPVALTGPRWASDLGCTLHLCSMAWLPAVAPPEKSGILSLELYALVKKWTRSALENLCDCRVWSEDKLLWGVIVFSSVVDKHTSWFWWVSEVAQNKINCDCASSCALPGLLRKELTLIFPKLQRRGFLACI